MTITSTHTSLSQKYHQSKKPTLNKHSTHNNNNSSICSNKISKSTTHVTKTERTQRKCNETTQSMSALLFHSFCNRSTSMAPHFLPPPSNYYYTPPHLPPPFPSLFIFITTTLHSILLLIFYSHPLHLSTFLFTPAPKNRFFCYYST